MGSIKVQYAELPDDDIKHLLKTKFHPLFAEDHIHVEGCTMPGFYKTCAEEILEFDVRDDDVFVVSFPKCGTTWTQEMVWCIGNDLDFKKARSKQIQKRFPFLENSAIVDFDTKKARAGYFAPKIPSYMEKSVEFVKNLKERRFIKTHLPLQLLPRKLQSPQRKAKMIYVTRDPRDACISYFHHYRLLQGYMGDFPSFLKMFLSDKITNAPFWKHVLDYWNIRHQQNLLFITYEDMKKDLPSVIERVATFLDKSLTPKQVDTLAHHLSFESMKNNPSVNYGAIAKITMGLTGVLGTFMRSGKSGAYQKDLTKEQLEEMNAWCERNLKGTDYVLPEHK